MHARFNLSKSGMHFERLFPVLQILKRICPKFSVFVEIEGSVSQRALSVMCGVALKEYTLHYVFLCGYGWQREYPVAVSPAAHGIMDVSGSGCFFLSLAVFQPRFSLHSHIENHTHRTAFF